MPTSAECRQAPDRRTRLARVLLSAALVCTALGAWFLAGAPGQERSEGPEPMSSAASPQAPTPTVIASGPALRVRAATADSDPTSPPATVPGVPEQVVLPRQGLSATVLGIDLVAGVLTPPSDPTTLGWWRGGAAPGAAVGTAVITGHTVHSGGGAFDDLEDVPAGDPVQVRTGHGSLAYTVESVQVLRKQQLAEQAERIFSQEVAGRLALITCEDWDGQDYRSNVVLIAVPA